MAGSASGTSGLPTKIAAPSTGRHTFGPIATKIKQEINPVRIAVTAPVELNYGF